MSSDDATSTSASGARADGRNVPASGQSSPSQAALSPGALPRRYGSWYVAEHWFRTMRAYLQTMLMTGIGTPLLYLYALGVGLATLVDQNIGAGSADAGAVGAVGYLVFVAPALLCSSAVTTAVDELTYPVIAGFKWNPFFIGMHAAPLQPRQIADGIVIAVSGRLLAQSTLYYLFMLLFGAVPSGLGFLAIVIATLTGLSFGVLVMAYSATIEQDKGQMNYVMRFVVLPMTLFSGTFFPLETLPVGLHWLGWISPLWHGTELARVASYGYQESLWLTVAHVAYLLVLLAAGVALARRITTRRLTR
ncbi:ABC transporter permease [Ruicaihuangia caeni]|uniref:ABC transporter permease n=1 Tax=Ruicaihuangia caeni TaxID=3042517 RepID=UPI00338E6EBE